MADIASDLDDKPVKKRGLRPLLLGLVLALLAGGGGFYATWSGLLKLPGTVQSGGEGGLPDIAFVPLDPVIVSFPPGSRSKHLRFSAQLEVDRKHRAEVELLRPRIIDLLNGYLRALEPSEIEAVGALVRLRAQMLRRIQIVTGEGRVRDLLVSEFVLN